MAHGSKLFFGAHRTSPFTPRQAMIIDDITSDDDRANGRVRVNVLVFNSMLLDHGRPEVEQVKDVLLLSHDTELVAGEETPWEWPAVNFVSAASPKVRERPKRAAPPPPPPKPEKPKDGPKSEVPPPSPSPKPAGGGKGPRPKVSAEVKSADPKEAHGKASARNK